MDNNVNKFASVAVALALSVSVLGCAKSNRLDSAASPDSPLTHSPSHSHDEPRSSDVDSSESSFKNVAVDLRVAEVERIVDGDTIVLSSNGVSFETRLIGIDAPESVSPDEEKNCEEGRVASDHLSSILPIGSTVFLEGDVSETDKYGRNLYCVWIDEPVSLSDESEISSKMLNAILVRDGYAESKRYPPDVKHSDACGKLMSDAIEGGCGISYLF